MGNKNTESVMKWRRNNPEKRRWQKERYMEKHRDEINARARERSRENYPKVKERLRARQKLVYERNSKRINEFKTQGCCLCQEMDMRCLDLHHVEPKTKTLSVSAMRTISEEKLELELEKCVVLCANCHRKTHDGNRNVRNHINQTFFPGRPRKYE